MMQAHPVVVQQPYIIARPEQNVGVKATRGLGVAQILVGAASMLFGIVSIVTVKDWVGYIGFGIWGGAWMLVGGMLGVCSSAIPKNVCLNWTNMAFAVVSSGISFLTFIVFAVSVTRFSSGHEIVGIFVYSILTLLMIAEFSIALSVSIFCCKYGCNSCCPGATTQMIVQQPPSTMMSSAPPFPASAAYPVSSSVLQGPYATLPPYSSQPAPYPYNMTYATNAGNTQGVNPTAMTYHQIDTSMKEDHHDPPPQYTQ